MTVAATCTPGGGSHGDSRPGQFRRAYGNDGFAINVMFDNGPLLLLTHFERVTGSNRSFYWNAGGPYKWTDWTLCFGFERSRFKSPGDFMLLFHLSG